VAASGRWPVGWLGAGLVETWNTDDYLAEAGIRYVSDRVNDDQPHLFKIGRARAHGQHMGRPRPLLQQQAEARKRRSEGATL
jgi:hypothetical protein